VTTITHEPLHV